MLGNIYSTFNIDFLENRGNIHISPRMVLNTSSADDADFGRPFAIKRYGANIWIGAGAVLFTTGTGSSTTYPDDAITQDATSGTPTNCDADYSDMDTAFGNLYVTTSTNAVYKYTGSAWSNFTAGSSSGEVRLLEPFGNRMYMTTSVSKVISFDSSNTVATSGQYTIQVSTDTNANIITCLIAGKNKMWIGCYNATGGAGKVYEWDGSSTQATREYVLESAGVLSGVVKDDIPYFMDVEGNLLKYNGASFQIIARMKQSPRFFTLPSTSRNTRFIHPNGMTIIRNKINFLINTQLSDVGSPIPENLPSGIYEYDEQIGIYHKASLSNNKSGDTITDYGSMRISVAGPLASVYAPYTGANINGSFMAGATYFTSQSATRTGVFYDDLQDTLQKAGNFVTIKIESNNITESWQEMFIKFKKLLSSSDKIVVKYRTNDVASTEATITWSDTNTFTSTADLSAYAVGDEVEITRGVGAGKCAHITAISSNAGTYTVDLDETFTSASGTASARFQKWTKLKSITSQNIQFDRAGISQKSPWIQFKVFAIHAGKDEIESLIIRHAPNETAN